jgi:PAS domain S-box-containing protein
MPTKEELEKLVAELENQLADMTTEHAEQIGQSQKMLQQVLDTIPIRVFWKDKDLNFLGCNQLAADDAGLDSPEEIIGKDDFQMPWAAQAELYRADDRRVIDSGQAKINYEEAQTTPTGSKIWLRTNKIPLRDTEGNITGVLGTYDDITARKQAEKEWAAAKTMLEAVVEQSPIPLVAVSTPDMIIRVANKASKELLGVADEGPKTGKSLLEFEQTWQDYDVEGNPVPLEELPLLKALQGIETRNVENKVVRKDGSERWEVVDGVPIYNQEGELIAGMIIFPDITERKQAEKEREKFQREMIEAQQRAIAELSTPVIPVMDRIIVMPMVGNIDSMRARDITRALLAGIGHHRAKVVILDVTGVSIMDTGIVNHLNKTIQAARLKGARTIVTGISDAVAESIVELGIDWSAIITLSDLQTGLLVALESLNYELRKKA